MCPRSVVGTGRGVECECVRREEFCESIMAREIRKEMKVNGAMKSCDLVSNWPGLWYSFGPILVKLCSLWPLLVEAGTGCREKVSEEVKT